MGVLSKKMVKRAVAALAAAMMMVPASAFAATHDVTEDRSSDTATITLGKMVTVNQDGKFPGISTFEFEITPVRAWDNANVDTAQSGAVIPASEMPMPAGSSAAAHEITVSGGKATVEVGDFTGSATTEIADTGTAKFRTTGVPIAFTKAGYYVYKIRETVSVPADVPGVEYDDHEYFVAVYVCNKTDENGNTVDGVYVHDITAYRNDSGEDDYQPDLSDIANVTDNGGTAASDNTRQQLAKVGKSDDEPGTDPETGLETGPDKLEAYRFWNDQFTHDVVLTENVVGNLADRTKDFEFTIELTGLEKGATYTTSVRSDTGAETSEGADLLSAEPGSVTQTDRSFTADENGNATLRVNLKDDEVFVMNSLPVTSGYKVTQAASDHVASYEITAAGYSADHSNKTDPEAAGSPVIANASDANPRDDMLLATAQETVDKPDGTVTIAFTDTRNLAVITGVRTAIAPTALILIVLAGYAFAALRRRDDDIC